MISPSYPVLGWSLSPDLAGTVARLRVLKNDLTTSELVTGDQLRAENDRFG
jgi:hypothetical protein